jgi:sialate O-acetylesterase
MNMFLVSFCWQPVKFINIIDNHTMKRIALTLLTFLSLSVNSFAEIRLPDIISDHMVLKQKSNVPLWGLETPGKQVSVMTSWDRKTYQVKADEQGNWKVLVKTPIGGGPYEVEIIGTSKIKITDVLIGEVWISSGQSNMAFRMGSDKQAKKMLPKATNKLIRTFKPVRIIAQEERTSFSAGKTKWNVSSPETVSDFSAMTYYFALELQEKLKVPVGVINVSWGGVSIESWLPKTAILSDPTLQRSVARWKKWTADNEIDSPAFVKDSLEYVRTKQGTKPKLPQSVYMARRPHRQHSVLYNGMTAPLVPFALSGILWYQGTSSVAWAEEYELQLNALIKTWRSAFNDPNLPVLVGQLTAFEYDEAKAYELRNAQLNQRKLKNAWVFCSMDLGDLKDVHPTNKQPYGQRFAGLALNKVYQQSDVPAMCPSFKGMVAKGDKLVVSFNDANGLHSVGGAPDEVYIAGADGKFVKAQAEVLSDQLVVSSMAVKQPKHVRYLYYNTVNVQLYNGMKLPLFPFEASLK